MGLQLCFVQTVVQVLKFPLLFCLYFFAVRFISTSFFKGQTSQEQCFTHYCHQSLRYGDVTSYTQTFVQFITMSEYFGCFHLFPPPPRLPSSVCWFLIGYMHKNCKHSWINKADRDLLVSYHIKAFSVAPLYCILLSAYSSSGFLKHFAQFIFFAAESSPPPPPSMFYPSTVISAFSSVFMFWI